MIKNFIFDFGNVLTQYNLTDYAQQMMNDRDKGVYLYENTFGNKAVWRDYDAGLITEPQVIELLCKETKPEYHEKIHEYIVTFDRCFTQYDEMIPVLEQLKQKGYKLFLLSNFPKEPFERLAARCPILDLLDVHVVSYRIHLAKPEPEIFEYILNEYNLKAQETLFADDIDMIIQAAISCGIHGHTFTTAKKYKEHLKSLGVI